MILITYHEFLNILELINNCFLPESQLTVLQTLLYKINVQFNCTRLLYNIPNRINCTRCNCTGLVYNLIDARQLSLFVILGSCLKTGQHFIFVIIYQLLPIKSIIFVSVSKILFIFFIANNNYDSNNENIAP